MGHVCNIGRVERSMWSMSISIESSIMGGVVRICLAAGSSAAGSGNNSSISELMDEDHGRFRGGMTGKWGDCMTCPEMAAS